jgi:superfamily II DNA or RNA helicase
LATGSGKSLVQYLLIRILLLTNKKILLIVPNISLVNQMKNDFKDWDENNDGKLDKTEYSNLIYHRMDANQDGIISKTEFNNTQMN